MMAKDTLSKTESDAKPAKKTVKANVSAAGAPAQLKQTSRKGKKAWRKNIDIQELEQGLEEIRAEERVIGTAVQNLKDSDLFQIDVKGDDNIRHHAPKFDRSQLTSARILAKRSAVPAVFSRTTSVSSQKRKFSTVSREEKERLLRIAKKPRKGPFNSVVDPATLQSGAAIVQLSEAVKQSGTYDAWAAEAVVEIPDGLETVQKQKVKPPVVDKPRDSIQVPAVVEPHQGTSYNPPVAAYQELLQQVHEHEVKRLNDAEKMAETKLKMEGALREVTHEDITVPPGMKLDHPNDVESSEEEDEGANAKPTPGQPKMKTTSQKNRAARIKAERQALADRLAKKSLLASIEQARSFRKTTAKLAETQEQTRLMRRLLLQEKLKKQGLAGRKLGKHKVPESQLNVQLGEDLSESLRGLKPEGNLFRDRFHSLQQRALLEPRNLVLPKKRKLRVVEYEKHAWKKFQ